MKVWDTFMLGGTSDVLLDLLECRLTELEDSDVYRHVIVEAPVTHQGKPKPLWYLEHQERFSPWADRITYVIAESLPDHSGPWGREHTQREYTFAGLTRENVEANDIIIHSDLDEILTTEGVERAKKPGHGIKFEQRCAVFAVDWVLPWNWPAPVAAYASQVWSFAQFRETAFPMVTEGAGWHLSWLGGREAIRLKKECYCHTEMDEYIERGMETDQFYGRGIFWGHGQGDTQLLAVDIDETWPRWVWQRKCPASWFRPRVTPTSKEES